ncbi:hydrogenase subunit CooU [Desulfolithobacter dissulfuricans]|uniref:Hydrogenase subunit CooU n=1 Tax=Desulfolithobacter dissulfuricans TaxID=2795293 RepID=A0A915U1K2_9BACT|nr:NADH-quinone oxidoreductase subunit C [Desulfolithobacter dissulfuricans]BCO09414.1 hydrogenase subunit CooU [Desulfolithobacter dissulfuricans]
MMTNKKELASTLLSELKVYVNSGFEQKAVCADSTGNQDLYVKLHDKSDIAAVATLVRKHGGRVVTVSPYVIDSGYEIAYHFDVDGVLLTATLVTEDGTVASITPYLKSADWTEREMQDLFDITLVDHPNPERLILDESIAQGIFKEYMTLSDAMAGAATNTLWERINEAKGAGNE